MTDTRGIDRVFDFVDSIVDKTDRVLNRAKYTEEQHKVRRSGRIKAEAKPSQASRSTAMAARRFRIIEAVDAQTGETVFTVTDGNSSAACSTRELAEKILHAVEIAP